MDFLRTTLQWFSGGSSQYHTLWMCMHGDTFWVVATVVLDLLVAVGYIMIAVHWWQNQKRIPAGPAQTALANMRNIFLFCGICGYIFIPIKMFWPAWRLYDCFMAVLVFFTWRYALSTRQLKVIYSELGRSKQLAADLEKSREEARKKGFFLNAVSHDLRTPLNALSLQASLLDMQVRTGDNMEVVRRAAGEIQSNVHAASELLDRLLEYARVNEAPDRNSLSHVNLGELIGQCVRGMRASAESRGIFLRAECPDDLMLRTDSLKVERILKNLISNAVKFTREGGVTIVAEGTRRLVEIRVIDTGTGIAPEHQEHLFHEFYQVTNTERDRQKGFGLGLAIARQLARQLGGEITCQSSVGTGSCFSIELPTQSDVADSIVRPAEPAAVLAG